MKRAIYIILALTIGYVVWPYISVAQLGQAVREGDVAALERKVEWESVRLNLKTDLSGRLSGEIQDRANQSGSEIGNLLAQVLAPGVSNSVVEGFVEATVTPENVAEMGRKRAGTSTGAETQSDSAAQTESAKREEMVIFPMNHIEWAFFTGPRQFEARLRPEREKPSTTFNFEFKEFGWKLVRIIPAEDFSLNAG
ncbi:MAG: DUF2939 domain-containing protein [Pseudomonadota bacterium]